MLEREQAKQVQSKRKRAFVGGKTDVMEDFLNYFHKATRIDLNCGSVATRPRREKGGAMWKVWNPVNGCI